MRPFKIPHIRVNSKNAIFKHTDLVSLSVGRAASQPSFPKKAFGVYTTNATVGTLVCSIALILFVLLHFSP